MRFFNEVVCVMPRAFLDGAQVFRWMISRVVINRCMFSKDICWVWYIVWEMSCGFVNMLPSSSLIHFIIIWLVSLKILLCMIFSFLFNGDLCWFMAFLQFVAVCLDLTL